MSYQFLSGFPIVSAISALFIYRLTGHFGPFWPAVFAGTVIVFLIGGSLIARGRGRYNFERLASTKASVPPLSFAEAFKRRRATCN